MLPPFGSGLVYVSFLGLGLATVDSSIPNYNSF